MVEKIVSLLKGSSRYRDRVEHIEALPSKEPIYGKLGKELPDSIKNYLSKKKIRLYSHQCEAIEALRKGENIIITTPTASGKTLAFNIPIFERLEEDKGAAALYLYPTKALSNDQLKTVKEFEALSRIGVNPNVYDGDTPPGKRPKIRETSRIIISNPYELHEVLPWHYKWQRFLSNLKFVVVDEAHRYRGVFGSKDFKTMALWFTVPENIKKEIWEKRKEDKDIKEKLKERREGDLKREVFAGGLHGIEHAMIGIMPFHVMCDRWDIGGVSTPNHPHTMKPTVFIYDGFEGGIGLAEKAFELFAEIVGMSHELVRDCRCEDGCPACIYSPKCGNENKPLDKKETILILEELLNLMEKKILPCLCRAGRTGKRVKRLAFLE